MPSFLKSTSHADRTTPLSTEKKTNAALTRPRNHDEIALRETENELRQSLRNFQALFPGQAAQDVRPTSWEDVQHAVSNVQKQWETRQKDSATGRIRDGFRRMCNTFNNHSTALKMLPSETEWVSVIAGSVSMIIKVRDWSYNND